ncbi:MAG: Gfo/Idh/MocA family oxidoreductase [Ruminococcaceae bacterium]|nr:Gfo/Idh/MocA family oxidoreductase [Oscillospiraceae bacterium]
MPWSVLYPLYFLISDKEVFFVEKKVKLGVVGLLRGLYVASELVNEEKMTIAAVCDKVPERVKAAYDKLTELGVEGLKTYTDYDEMLNSDIDAVYVVTDAICHVPFVLKALEKGKHVLSEIPTIASLEEAKQLKAAVKNHPELKYMAAENVNYWDNIRAWKKMREEGKFGTVIYAEGEYFHHDPSQPIDGEMEKGHWRESLPSIRYITHEMGPLLDILDDECVSVSCMVPDVKCNPYKKGPENGVAIFKTRKGAVIRILIFFGAYVGFAHNYRVIGTHGSIQTDSNVTLDEARCYAAFSDLPGSIKKKEMLPIGIATESKATGGHGGADVKMMRDFIDCIVEDREPYLNVDRGIKMSLPGIIAHESSLQGGALMEIPVIE